MKAEWLFLQSPLLVIVCWTETMRYHSAEHMVLAQRGLLLFVIFPLMALLFVLKHRLAKPTPAN